MKIVWYSNMILTLSMEAIDEITRLLCNSSIDDYSKVITEYKAEELILEAWVSSIDGDASPLAIFAAYIDSSAFKDDQCPIRRRLWIENTYASAEEVANVFMGLPDHHKHWIHIYSWTYGRNTADIHKVIKIVENDHVALSAAMKAFIERADKISIHSQDFESIIEYYYLYDHLKAYLSKQIIWAIGDKHQRFLVQMVLDQIDVDTNMALDRIKDLNYHLYTLLCMHGKYI